MREYDTVRLEGTVQWGPWTLESEREGLEVVAEAEDGEHAVALVTEARPDVAVLDLSMPRLSGLDATRQIRRMDSPPEVIVVTVHSDAAMQEAVFAAGALGYVLKSAAATELQAAVATVMRGERYSSVMDEPAVGGPTSRLDVLTSREREVLALDGDAAVQEQLEHIAGAVPGGQYHAVRPQLLPGGGAHAPHRALFDEKVRHPRIEPHGSPGRLEKSLGWYPGYVEPEASR